MSKIEIQKKTLLIIAVLIVVVITAGYLITPRLLTSTIEKLKTEENAEKALVLKDRLIRFFPGSAEARWEAFELADQLINQQARIMIGPDFTSGGPNQTRSFGPDKVISYLQRVANAQSEAMWEFSSWQKIAQLYSLEGDYSNAEKFYEIAREGFSKNGQGHKVAEVSLSLSKLYLEEGDWPKALTVIEQVLSEYPQQQKAECLLIKADSYMAAGDFAKARANYEAAASQTEKDLDIIMSHKSDKESSVNPTLDMQPVYRESKAKLSLIESILKGNDEVNAQVNGEIMIGSTPLPNVLVYLINEQEYDGRMTHLEGMAVSSPVKTDERGKFSIQGLAAGQYFVVLGVLPEDLEGLGRFKGLETFKLDKGETVNLSYVFQPRISISQPSAQQPYREGDRLDIVWEKADQAVSYNLNISLKLDNGYVARVYRQGLTDTNYTFEPEGIALREMNFVARSDGMILSPSAILGSFYPGAEIFFVVEAYDKNGRSISDSEGYVLALDGNYPSIKVVETKLYSAGDKLVAEKKYSEAEQAYLQECAMNPQNPYTLLALARIYNYGWDEGTDDPAKAMIYYNQLLQITREKFIVEEAAATAVRPGHYNNALKLFEEIQDGFEQHSFWFHLMGELYLRSGQADKAFASYKRYLDGQTELRDLGPVIALLYKNDIPAALLLLNEKKYSLRVRHNASGESQPPANIAALIYNLEQYQKGMKSKVTQGDFLKYLIQIVSIDGNSRFEKVQAFEDSIRVYGGNDVLVQVLLELAKDRY